MALRTDVRARSASRSACCTIVVGHATFCIVLVYNNAIARLRRTSRSLEEASADLGADTFQTFRHVTFPAMRTALLAGALLAFALSFDEVIVTIFTAGGVKTLPIWIFQSFRLANQVPLVNVAGVVAILLSVIPVYIATRLSSGAERPAPESPPAHARLDDHEQDGRSDPREGDEGRAQPRHGLPPPAVGRHASAGGSLRGVPDPTADPHSD